MLRGLKPALAIRCDYGVGYISVADPELVI